MCKDDGKIIEAKSFVPMKKFVANGYRYWIRSFFEVDKAKKLIIPITFLIDTGNPFNMLISNEMWNKLVETKLLREATSRGFSNDKYGEIIYMDRGFKVKKSKCHSMTQNYNLNVLGGEILQIARLTCGDGTFVLDIPQEIKQ